MTTSLRHLTAGILEAAHHETGRPAGHPTIALHGEDDGVQPPETRQPRPPLHSKLPAQPPTRHRPQHPPSEATQAFAAATNPVSDR